MQTFQEWWIENYPQTVDEGLLGDLAKSGMKNFLLPAVAAASTFGSVARGAADPARAGHTPMGSPGFKMFASKPSSTKSTAPDLERIARTQGIEAARQAYRNWKPDVPQATPPIVKRDTPPKDPDARAAWAKSRLQAKHSPQAVEAQPKATKEDWMKDIRGQTVVWQGEKVSISNNDVFSWGGDIKIKPTEVDKSDNRVSMVFYIRVPDDKLPSDDELHNKALGTLCMMDGICPTTEWAHAFKPVGPPPIVKTGPDGKATRTWKVKFVAERRGQEMMRAKSPEARQKIMQDMLKDRASSTPSTITNPYD